MREHSQAEEREHEVGAFGAGNGEGIDVVETGKSLYSAGSNA